MKAILLEAFGGPEVLRPGEADDPEPGADQVLVRVMATSVNRPDVIQRQGNYPPPPGESDIPGLEVAGVIEKLGADVTGWKAGDRVMALVGGGGYAELASAYAAHLIAIPESMSFEEAACVCETYITAYLNLFLIGGLTNGETALLHGGGGGVCTAAIQLCGALRPEARVIVTASTGKVDRVRAQGVALVVDYRQEDFVERVREYTNNEGSDVILDHIGGPYLPRNMKALAVGGRLVEIGVMGGPKAELNIAMMMVKRQRIIGSVLRPRPVEEKGRISRKFADEVLPHMSNRTIVPLIHEVYPLDEAAEAHRAMESSTHFGKIVLRVG
jgi:putative PIG3 family NAD(P)H quinone oxidoreductase